jgi:hypothetical protein
MLEQKRKKIVGMRGLRGWGKWVMLKLRRVGSSIYHDYKGLMLPNDREQKDHTPLKGYWGWVEMIAASLGAGETP